jgi:hypothetical protein
VRLSAAPIALATLLICPAAAVSQAPSAIPPLLVFGFADVNYLETERPVDEGFRMGQVVGHVSAGLSERLVFFGEVSATARPDQYRIEVERAILRYEFGDPFKISVGRYHTPINWWNTAYHHGLWLQTTIGRPEMTRFGGSFIPVHFVGLLVEGSYPTTPVGFGYTAGVGNGRHLDPSRAGDAGDVTRHRAFLASVHSRPPRFARLQLGGAAYVDRAVAQDGDHVEERILSAHAVWSDETPEAIAEYARILHESTEDGEDWTSDAWYLQLAYRLPGDFQRLKPYARIDRIGVPEADVFFGPLELGYRGRILGTRYDFAPLAALKLEYRHERFDGEPWSDSLWAQASFTFGAVEHGR